MASTSGLFLGAGLAIPLADGDVLSAISAILLLAGIAVAFRTWLPTPERGALSRFAVLAFSIHLSVATILHAWSLAAGRKGFITGDDGAYANLAWALAQFLRGEPQPPFIPPAWGGDEYLMGTWVYLEAALFYLFGPRVLLPLFFNAAFATLLALPVFDATRRLFGRQAAFLAAVLATLWPSLVLWSSLNLKDALALLLIAVVLWALLRFQLERRWLFLVLTFAPLLLMESLRRYLFVGLSLVIPASVWLMPELTWRPRLAWGTLASAVSLALVVSTQAGISLGSGLLASFESVRESMALGANTAFVEQVVTAAQGDMFCVAGSDSSPDTTSAPGCTGTPIRVAPGTRIVLVASGPPPEPAPGVVYARRGDLILVGGPETTPAPGELPRQLVVPPSGVSVHIASPQEEQLVFTRTLAHIPRGLAYALFAPFPWSARRLLDLPAIAEMIAWYLVLIAALWTLWKERSQWRLLVGPVLFLSGTMLLFALVEGNVGTLFRHRAMVIPATLALAAPTLLRLTRLGRSGARIWRFGASP